MDKDSLFDQVYDEAFASATGAAPQDAPGDFYTSLTQTYEDTLSRMTDPEAPTSPLPYRDGLLMIHPYAAEFEDRDILRIAQVRLLGRSIIEIAKQSIMLNPELRTENTSHEHLEMRIFDTIIEPLAEKESAGERVFGDKEAGGYEHAASPLRLEHFPHGEHVSCLGIAVCAVAMCELHGAQDFVFASEIRNGDARAWEHHEQLRDKLLDVHFPWLKDKQDKRKRIVESLLRTDEDESLYKRLFFGQGSITTQMRLSEFHHYVVLGSTGEGGERTYAQVDPYALSLSAFLGPSDDEPRLIDLVRNPTTVVNHEERSFVDGLFRKFAQALPIVQKAEQDVARLIDDTYKEKDMVAQLENHIVTYGIELASHLITSGDPDAEGNTAALERIAYMLDGAIRERFREVLVTAYKEYKNESEEVYPSIDEMNRYEDADITSHEKVMEAVDGFIDQVRHTTGARTHLKHVASALIVGDFMQRYVQQHVHTLKSATIGIPNATAEFSEPDFMIGALYLNHYATHRKSGIVNVSKELSRLSPSQPLWLAAHQEGDLNDERIEAVSAIIKALPPQRVLPTVNVIRHLQ